jgi:hypothetical protein
MPWMLSFLFPTWCQPLTPFWTQKGKMNTTHLVIVGTVSDTMWTACSSIFFMLLKNTAKQLKLRDPSGNLAPMHKLASERKICSMYKIISLSFISRVWVQRDLVQLELDFLLPLKLGVLGLWFGLWVLSTFNWELNCWPNSSRCPYWT